MRRIVQVIAAAALACVLVAGCAAQTSVGRKPAAEGTDIATFLGDEEISHLLDGYESDAPQMMVVTQGNGMAATVASTRDGSAIRRVLSGIKNLRVKADEQSVNHDEDTAIAFLTSDGTYTVFSFSSRNVAKGAAAYATENGESLWQYLAHMNDTNDDALNPCTNVGAL